MSTSTSPRTITRSTPSSASCCPYDTRSLLAAATSTATSGVLHPFRGRGGGGVEARRWRSGAACRRASRIDRGSGSHPTRRPSSTKGGATGEERMITSGGPSTSGAPSPGTITMRSAKGTTRSSRCSAMTTVSPTSCTRRARVLKTSSAAAGSSAEVGSSSTRIRGEAVSTAPIATRCCWPPDNVRKDRSRSSWRPRRSRVSSTRRRIASVGTPRFSMVYASSSSTVSVTNVANGFCPTKPTTSARSRGRLSLVVRPSTVTVPANVPPLKCGISPLMARNKVVFPDPVSPTTTQSSPSGMSRVTRCSVGRDAPE